MDKTTEETTATETMLPPATLPTDYLVNGYYATTENGKTYLLPEVVATHAQHIATVLSTTMTATAIRRLTAGLRTVKSKQYPFEAKQTALIELSHKMKKMVQTKKAPALLKDFVVANQNAIKNNDDFTAYIRHLEAIQNYMELDGGDA